MRYSVMVSTRRCGSARARRRTARRRCAPRAPRLSSSAEPRASRRTYTVWHPRACQLSTWAVALSDGLACGRVRGFCRGRRFHVSRTLWGVAFGSPDIPRRNSAVWCVILDSSIGSPDITRGSVAACIQERGDRAPCHQRITMPKGEPSPDARFFGSPPLSPWPRLTSQCTHRRRSVRFSCRRRPR